MKENLIPLTHLLEGKCGLGSPGFRRLPRYGNGEGVLLMSVVLTADLKDWRDWRPMGDLMSSFGLIWAEGPRLWKGPLKGVSLDDSENCRKMVTRSYKSTL